MEWMKVVKFYKYVKYCSQVPVIQLLMFVFTIYTRTSNLLTYTCNELMKVGPQVSICVCHTEPRLIYIYIKRK